MKPERKTLMPIFALLAAALFAGCSMDSNDTVTNDTIVAATAETITASELADTSWSYSTTYDYDEVLYPTTVTLKFESDGKVTHSYKNDREGEVERGSYTYTVDGSTVTISYQDGDEWGQLIYLSDQLVQVLMVFSLEGSSASGSTVSLAGTTWTYSFEGTDDYDQSCTYTYTIKFESDGTATSYSYKDSELIDTSTVRYTVSGSTVTFTATIAGEEYSAKYIYSSGKLIYGTIYTKD